MLARIVLTPKAVTSPKDLSFGVGDTGQKVIEFFFKHGLTS